MLLADAQVALTVFAEAHAQGRRVAVLGSATELAQAFAEAGASLVHVYDAHCSVAYSPGAQVTVLPWPTQGFGVRDGAFDLVVLPAADALTDLPGVLREMRRILASDGCALLAFSATGPLAYDDAFNMLQLQFAYVRMFAQLPFRGVLMAELGVTDAEVTVDQSAAPPGVPPAFVAVVSAAELQLESYAIIAVPSPPAALDADLATTTEGTTATPAPAHDFAGAPAASARDAQQAEIAELSLRVTYLQAEVDREHRTATELLPYKEEARRAQALEAELSKATDMARAADHRASEALNQASKLAVEAERLGREVDRLSQDLERRAEALTDALSGALTEAPPAKPVEAAQPPAPDPNAASQAEWEARLLEVHAEGEARLAERAVVIRELEEQLQHARNMVRELALRVGLAESGIGSAHALAAELAASAAERALLRAQLDTLAFELAQRDAELAVRAWATAASAKADRGAA